MRFLLILALLVATAYLSLCAWLYFMQRSQIYFAVQEANPPGAQSIRLTSGASTLKIWVVERPGPRALVYFGGNAEDVSVNLPIFASAIPDHSLYLVNYRGYGGSTGTPSESALVTDAFAVYDRLHARYPDISVMGRSLGTGVAVQLAAAREVRRLVLVTPYDSLANVAGAHFPMFPVAFLMRDRYDSASHAAWRRRTGAGRHRQQRRNHPAREFGGAREIISSIAGLRDTAGRRHAQFNRPVSCLSTRCRGLSDRGLSHGCAGEPVVRSYRECQ